MTQTGGLGGPWKGGGVREASRTPGPTFHGRPVHLAASNRQLAPSHQPTKKSDQLLDSPTTRNLAGTTRRPASDKVSVDTFQSPLTLVSVEEDTCACKYWKEKSATCPKVIFPTGNIFGKIIGERVGIMVSLPSNVAKPQRLTRYWAQGFSYKYKLFSLNSSTNYVP